MFIDWQNPLNMNNPLMAGCVSRWRAGEGPFWGGPKFYDLVPRSSRGGGNHGTLTLGAKFDGPLGRPGGTGAIRTDGTDDYVSVLSSLVIPTGSLTMFGWVRPQTLDGSTDYICGVQNSGSDGGRFVRINASNQLQFEVIGNSVKDANSGTLTVNQWIHFVAVKDGGSTAYLYINGLQVGSVSLSGVTYSATLSNFVIGARPDFPGSNNCNMLCDDIGVVFRAYSAGEVLSLYQATKSPYDPTLNWIDEDYYFGTAGGAVAASEGIIGGGVGSGAYILGA